MKKNFSFWASFVLVLLWSNALYSQEYFTQLRRQLDETYSELNLDQVKTGFLQDYGIEYVELDRYQNGIEPEKYLSAPSFLLLLESYYDCAVQNKSKADLPDLKRYSERFLKGTYADYCPVGLLVRKYNYIAPTAKSLFSMNANRRLISRGSPQQLYAERAVVAMAPRTFMFKDKSIPLVFPKSLAIMDGTDPIVSISIRLSSDPNQVYQTSLGGRVVLEPTKRGEIICALEFISRSGLSYKTSTLFYIAPEDDGVAQQTQSQGLRSFHSTTKVPFSANQHHDGGTLEIEMRSGRTQIEKPILIVEGFDAGRYFPDVSMDGESFFNQKDNFWLWRELKTLGYDICYLDYNNGIADIYRNAELAKEAIRYINSHKNRDSEESQLVVLGHSMGGLVACCALRGMEINEEKHDTWKYISYDSPHYGASVPPSAIYAVNQALYGRGFRPLFNAVEAISPLFKIFGGDEINMMQPISGLLHSKAAQQMLQLNTRTIENATSKILILGEEEYYQNKEYASFMERYHKDGLPQKTKNVAFSNGSLSGETTYKDKSRTTPLFRMGGSFWLGATLFDLLHNDQTLGSVLAKLLIGPSTIEVSIEGYPISPRVDFVYQGEMFYRKYFFFFPIDHTISKIQVRNPYPKSMMISDFATGGTLDMDFSADRSIDYFVGGGWYHFSQTMFTLVPRNSALAIPPSNRDITQGAETLDDLQEASPFDIVYIHSKRSLPHTTLGEDEQLKKLKRELSERVPPRAYSPQVSGPNVIAPLDNAVYTISNPNRNSNPRLQTYSVWLYMGEGQKTQSMRVSNYEFWRLASDTLVVNGTNLDPGKYEIKLFTFNKETNKLEGTISYLFRSGEPDIRTLTIEQDKAIPVQEMGVSRYILYLPTLKLSYSGYGDITGIEFRRADEVWYPIVDYRHIYNPKEAVVGELLPKNSVALLTTKSFSNHQIGNTTTSLIEKQTEITISNKQEGLDINKGDIHIDPPEYNIDVPSYLIAKFSDIAWVQTFTSLPTVSRVTGEEVKLKLQVRLQNQAGWSDWSKPFEYHYTGRSENSNLCIAPNIVTSFGSDAVLQTAGDSATAPLPYGNVYLVAIFSNATGKLCSRTTVSIGSPIGLVNLPNDVYIIKVYNYRGQECGSFSAIKK